MEKASVKMKRIDFHTHTFFSDGDLLPAELVNRALTLEHEAIAITDHAGPSNLEQVLDKVKKVSSEINAEIRIIPGVELTHVPISLISDLAARARKLGAEVVLVHGETIVEPVPPGTNLAALKCDDVDILAHPGMLSEEEARIASETGTYLEITSRDGHSLTNGRVARLSTEFGAEMVINTDTHSPEDLITKEEAKAIALGSGLEEDAVNRSLNDNPRRILEGL
ncbi:MAG: histidinol phosphate phosphatase domain-containing protein [Candidatus Hadarchaeota archaeon]